MTRWEFRRARSYLRKSIREPTFITLQTLSIIVVILVIWLLWTFIFILPDSVRGAMYWMVIDSGLIGVNTVWLVYAVLSLIIAQQIVKAVMSAPLGSQTERADVDYLFPAPMKGHVYYSAKYLRSIPRRITMYLYVIIAFQPILWYFGMFFGLTVEMFLLFLVIAFLLAEIGSVATQGLYSLHKLALQPRSRQLIIRIGFYFGLILGTVLLLSPVWPVYGVSLPSPMYSLAYLLVAILFSGATPGSDGWITYLHYPTLPWVLLGLTIAYFVILFLTRWLTDKVTVDMYEEIGTVARRKGTTLGTLSRLPISFASAKSPIRSLINKDFVTGLRKSGKTFYIVGLSTNFVFAGFFAIMAPVFLTPLSLPMEFLPILEILYAVLLVVIVPLLTISSSDPFQGEYGTLYLLRLSQVRPLQLTLVKYLQFLVTPICLALPFAVYFAAFLGNFFLLIVAIAILPHAILIATAIGIGLGSRYPYVLRTKHETPIALLITFPVLSWVAIIPVLIFQLGFLPGGILLMLLSSLLVAPYTLCLVLILLSWASHSYLRQE